MFCYVNRLECCMDESQKTVLSQPSQLKESTFSVQIPFKISLYHYHFITFYRECLSSQK